MKSHSLGFSCTTIDTTAKALEHNLSSWLSSGYGPARVALDRKTKLGTNFENDKEFILFTDQPKSDHERLCSWDSYTRKNISYAHLAKEGVDAIFETDDDNYIYTEKFEEAVSSSYSLFKSCSSIDLFDTSNVFAQIYKVDHNIWARGYPLPWIEDGDNGAILEGEAASAGVVQFLVDGNPDVDAIYRLIFGPDVDIPATNLKEPNLVFGRYHPFNSQATLWPRESFPLMYLPTNCDFRMTDIWRGYIAQHILYHQNRGVVFAPSIVRQDRNPHKIYSDFYGEHEGYKKTPELLNCLTDIHLEAGEPYGESLFRVYSELIGVGLFAQNELTLLSAFLESLE
jgi:hypothetical protein